ncbi:MAG: DNA cytosine methyltransferase [Deltaproteobacteria bacterium]|nr:DNA cytosine methyltransferase [Deltaproteobacteria bacterium]
MKKVVDLFAGCGGFALGFQNAGFNIVSAFELWDIAVATYQANFKHPVYKVDLSDVKNAVETIKPFGPEIIIGGPPCQEFSHAGKRVEDKLAGLTIAYADIVSNVLPFWFVMENVDRAQKSSAYASARMIFKKAGYGLTELVLKASQCGIPQRRKRFFCIGSQYSNDNFLTEYIYSKTNDKEMTLRDYFGTSLDFEFYYRHPRNYSRRAIYSIDEPSPTIRGINRPVPAGYPGHARDACELNHSIRSLTTLERSLIQTFPPNFKWRGNKTEIEQLIGNAVPVKLAEFVANALAFHVNN